MRCHSKKHSSSGREVVGNSRCHELFSRPLRNGCVGAVNGYFVDLIGIQPFELNGQLALRRFGTGDQGDSCTVGVPVVEFPCLMGGKVVGGLEKRVEISVEIR